MISKGSSAAIHVNVGVAWIFTVSLVVEFRRLLRQEANFGSASLKKKDESHKNLPN